MIRSVVPIYRHFADRLDAIRDFNRPYEWFQVSSFLMLPAVTL